VADSKVRTETDATRAARIARIKRQIAAGTYETPDRIDAAVESMLSDEQFSSGDSPAEFPSEANSTLPFRRAK